MSGGYFDYKHHEMNNIVESLEHIVENNPRRYSQETIDKFKQAIATTMDAYDMVHCIDYLLSDDTGEDTFHKQWHNDIVEKV